MLDVRCFLFPIAMNLPPLRLISSLFGAIVFLASHAGARSESDSPAGTKAATRRAPMTAAETREFMKRLAAFVFEHHMKREDLRAMDFPPRRQARLGRASLAAGAVMAM
jgi:hypothetical protein